MSDPRNPNQNQRGRDNDPGRHDDADIQDRAHIAGRPGYAGQSASKPLKEEQMQSGQGRKEGWAGDNPRQQTEASGKKYADSKPDKSGKRGAPIDHDADDRNSRRKDAQR
ncbi:MAG: hypothetical protein Dbin4_00536 [Alphaproteobacteria bacterium]|nr:hypothetical protein [Alphaproteobacteria bacterium]